MVHTACRKVLLAAGFTPDDYYTDNVSLNGMSEVDVDEHMMTVADGGDVDGMMYEMEQAQLIQMQQESDMNYTQQANKRSYCKRLTRCHVDVVVVSCCLFVVPVCLSICCCL